MPPLRSRSFRAMLLASFCGFGGFAVLFPVVPLWADEGGADRFGAGATTGALMLSTVLTQVGVPSLLRRYGQRYVLVAGMVLIGLPTPLYALSADLGPLLGVSVLRGVGFGMLTVAGSALVASLVPPAQHARAAAQYGIAVGAPQLALVPAGVGLVEVVGFEALFWAAGALSVVGAVVALAVHPPAEPAEPNAPSTRALEARWIVPFLAMFSCSVAQGGLITFVPLARSDDTVLTAAALFATTAAALVGRLVAGELGGPGRLGLLTVIGVPVAAAGMLLSAFVLTDPGGLADTALVLGALLVGLGFGLVQNDSLVGMFAGTANDRIGAASAVWNIAYDTGTGVGAAGLGAIAQQASYGTAFAASAGLLVVSGMWATMDRCPSSTPRPPP